MVDVSAKTPSERKAIAEGRVVMAAKTLDLVLAGIIFAGLPESATWALGLLVGINMVFGGTAMIGMALAARPHA